MACWVLKVMLIRISKLRVYYVISTHENRKEAAEFTRELSVALPEGVTFP